ncbi:MAG: hypothetical protein KGD67_11885, partial [Candidatus Lokiarchaeota archaeon]|nr:hypothetical protein [Candidatus Lokiarchaeota archaeon]
LNRDRYMCEMERISRRYLILLLLLIYTTNLCTLTFFPQEHLNIKENNDIPDQRFIESVPLKSSITAIENTTITKQTQYSYNFDINMPSFRPDGDLYIAQIIMDDYVSFSSVPDGWTEIENGYQSAAGRNIRFATYWKIGSSEPATYTWNCSKSRLWLGAIHRISSFDPVTPIHKSSISSGMTANPTAPSVTTTIDECFILTMFG